MSFDLKIINGDLSIANGALKTVIDSEKLIQDVLKICLTPSGSNPMIPWYGSLVHRSLVGSVQDIAILMQLGKSQLTTALENLRALQDLQVKSYQRMTADEQIHSIMDISIIRNQLDLRLIDVRLKIISKGFKPITTAFQVSTI